VTRGAIYFSVPVRAGTPAQSLLLLFIYFWRTILYLARSSWSIENRPADHSVTVAPLDVMPPCPFANLPATYPSLSPPPLLSPSPAEPFREPVDWKALGLFDYPQIIKKPMDLGEVKANLESGMYKSLEEAVSAVRLIWDNCMKYNADGSDFYNLAQNLSKKFEEKFAKLEKDLNAAAEKDGKGSKGGASKGGSASEPSLEDKRIFAKNLYKISKEDLGKVIVELDTKCPAALTKNSSEDEVEINVDMISSVVFAEVSSFAKGAAGGNTGRTKKKGSAGSKRKSSS